MNEPYILQDVINIIIDKCNDPVIRAQLENYLEYRNITKDELRDIIKETKPYNRISKDQVIIIYNILSNIVDVNPMSDYFEETEIKNADAYSKLYDSRELLRILSNKGVRINPDRKVDFIINEYILKYKDKKTNRDVINKFAQMAIVEGNYGKDLCDFNQNEFIDLLSSYSTNAFGVYKNIITKYINWCYKNGYTSEAQLITIQELTPGKIDNQALYLEQYFASVKQILDLFEKIDRELSDVEPISEHVWYNVILPTLVLSWIGFDVEEIVQLKVSDIDVNTGEILCPITGKRISNIPQEFMALIENTQHIAKMSAVEYLLFTDGRSNNDKPLPENLIAQKITGLNKRAVESGISKKFSTKKVRLSGNYSRMYEYEKEIGRNLNTSDIDIFSVLCRQEIQKTRMNIIMKDYEKWKQALLWC